MLGFISKSVASRVREIILPFCLAPVRLHLKYCVQFGVLQYQKDTDTLEQIKWTVTRMVRGTKCTKYKQRLRELFSLEKRRRDLSAVYNYLRGGYRDNRTRVFLRVHSDRTRGNRYKLQHRKFQWSMWVGFVCFSSPLWEWSNIKTGTQRGLCNLCPWRYSTLHQTKCWATWCKRTCFEQEVRLDDLQGHLLTWIIWWYCLLFCLLEWQLELLIPLCSGILPYSYVNIYFMSTSQRDVCLP